MKHSLNQTLLGSGALASLLLSASLVSCQDEDYGYTQSEVYQSYIERKYAEEFAKVFPKVDPEHTWMCTPDTTYIEVEVPGMTRAGAALSPSITSYDGNKTTNMAYASIKEVLNYMFETEDNYSNYKAATDFEYKAVENTYGEGYEVYTITPTFWGRKFVDHNSVGVYYMNGDQKVDMNPFWDDNTNRHIEVHYNDGDVVSVPISDQQITDNPTWANSGHNTSTDNDDYLKLWKPCDYCGLQFVVKEAIYNDDNTIKETTFSGYDQKIKTKEGWESIQVFDADKAPDDDKTAGYAYDTQLFVYTPNKTWNEGERYKFHMKYISSSYSDNEVNVQYHSTPGDWIKNGKSITLENGKDNNDWKEITFEGTVNSNNVKTIAINLNVPYQTTYNFRDITWESITNPCNHEGCEHGRVYVNHYQLPQYTLKVPVGTVWGMYLITDKQQTSNSEKVKWYSNSTYNPTNQTSGTGRVKSAATFTFNDVTYISFEDAPTVCDYRDSNGNIGNGECTTCGYGHWDHDYNDIVLTISPRPVTKAYNAISYRVMCEDLGGTFDWDFNDVVFDVLYTDGRPSTNYKATIEYKLQAIGGTLPIYMGYDENSNGQYTNLTYNGKEELHEMTGLTKDNKDLYTPVNVACNLYHTETKDPIVLKTVTLDREKYSDGQLDIRDYVHKIKIVATQKNGNTSTVKFPEYKGDRTPQCFMTNTGTPWPDELQPITDKYPKFKPWVESFDPAPNWWEVDN